MGGNILAVFSKEAKKMDTYELEAIVDNHELKVKTMISAAEKFVDVLGERVHYVDDDELVGKRVFLYDYKIDLMYGKPRGKNTLWLYHGGSGVIDASYKSPLHEIRVSRYINGEWETEFLKYAKNPDKYIQLLKSKNPKAEPKKHMSADEIKKRKELLARAKRLGLHYIEL